MGKGLFHMEGNGLFKAKISTKEKDTNLQSEWGILTHILATDRMRSEKSLRKQEIWVALPMA